MILSVTLNPCIDHAIFVSDLHLGDTNRVVRTEIDAGGKGVNLSRVVAELGGETIATGFLGGGPGAHIREVLSRQGVQNSFIEIRGVTRTNFSVEDTSGQPPTTFNDRGPEIQAEEWDDMLAWIEQVAPRVGWVAFGGSLPPGLPTDAFSILGKLARGKGCRIVIDADGEPMRHALEFGPCFIKPNAKEAERLVGYPVKTDEEAFRAAGTLYERLGAESFVVISRGGDGAVLRCAEGTFKGIAPAIEPHSTIGSGDSMIAGMLWAFESGFGAAEALRWGLAAGAATAVTDGSEIARRPVIELLYNDARVLTADA